uniref:non-specific serine/threonine protein kinase n=3 Tax=Rhodnius TaxID=13248 RepID=T1HNR1_RHOPR
MTTHDPYHVYIYNLPYAERKKLCRILDYNNVWEELGGMQMKFDVASLQQVGAARFRGQSPSDELLSLWGTQNHTVLQLFVLLSKMHHYQAMMVLKPLVDPKYHRLIYEGEENFSQILPAKGPLKQPQESSIGSSTNKTTQVKANNNLLEEDNNMLCKRKEWNKDKLALKIPCNQNETTVADGLSPMISYVELEIATGGWDDRYLLGRGGFGTVYKGSWKNTLVAIKRLQVQKGDEGEMWKTHREQSLKELRYLNSCKHDNILALYGYSFGGPHDCLVYQYMPNGSLEDRLLCREGSKPLGWIQRHSIAKGTARGLQFLHTIGTKPLVHGDIKSANILLDSYLEPKIGDFGLAREGPLQQYTHVKVSRVHGTRPYLPDEFLRAKKFSTKVDTYSFGIVLFELATGLRAYDEYRKHKFLKDHVLSVEESQICETLRDTRGGPDDHHVAGSLVKLGKWCISARARERPEMVLVLHTLENG